jgi:ubiquinone/menaquinone biosynthesis C-methylase UbiE
MSDGDRSCGCGSKDDVSDEEVRRIVRAGYAKISKEGSCCNPVVSSTPSDTDDLARHIAKRMGYRAEELDSIPDGANLGLGCGNPVALASLEEGETVADLGSGGGLDCFLAADRVGPTGRVIGVDMTPEMIERARGNAESGDYSNVEFRLGKIEELPIDDDSVDAVISNCVINLSPDKERTFAEAFRVLRPGGRLMVSDIVLMGEIPESIRKSAEALVSCLGGAVMRDEYLQLIGSAGFSSVKVVGEMVFPISGVSNVPNESISCGVDVKDEDIAQAEGQAVTIKVLAWKPE